MDTDEKIDDLSPIDVTRGKSAFYIEVKPEKCQGRIYRMFAERTIKGEIWRYV